MSTLLTVLFALTPAAHEEPSHSPGSRFQEFFSTILPYRDGALFDVPYRFLPIVASLQTTSGNEDNPREQMLREVAAFEMEMGASVDAINPMGWVDELALDWGTAEIGPGVLFPHGMQVPRRNGFPPGGRPDSNGSPFFGLGGDLDPPSLTDPGPGPGGDPTDPQKVPEPASVLAWLFAMGAAYVWRNQRRFGVAQAAG